jgi:hypothetical protein
LRYDGSRPGGNYRFDASTAAAAAHSEREEPVMYIDKAEIIARLRARGLDARADWVDRQLPRLVDPREISGLLATLGIDPADIPTVDATTQSA